MQDQETPKKRVHTRWDQPALTAIGFTSLAPPQPTVITDVDGIVKCQRLVEDICEASREIQEGERECDLMQQSLVDVNWMLKVMNKRMVDLESEIGAAGELSALRRESNLYADLFANLNDPLDFTLPWPPTTPEVVNRYQALLKQAAREVSISVHMTENRLRPYLTKKQKSSEISSTSTPSSESAGVKPRERMEALVTDNLRTATQIEDWAEYIKTAEDIQALPLPVYMPSYPEPYKESKLPNLPAPNIPPQVAALMNARQWTKATEKFLLAVDHTFTEATERQLEIFQNDAS